MSNEDKNTESSSLPYEAQCAPNKEDERSLWDRFWAGYSPILFGNEEEQRAARERLGRSMKKEAYGMVGGYVDVLTILPPKIPTNVGTFITDIPMGLNSIEQLREGYLKHINKK